ncbi:DUF2760 domain-containing protein, partial [Cupriavidus taiwanensis]|uniref:DUF2760 domain-containing protein n=1 Tax=Cupriavidus taiwanensis TaxID=164546 RepID=UPI0039EB9CEA
MPDSNLSFFGRLSLAMGTFFAILGNRELAAGIKRLRAGEPAAQAAPVSAPAPAPVAEPAPALKEASPVAALQLLGLLQRDARFVDFVEEDIARYADAEIDA